MSSSTPINYARAIGIETVAPAVIFAVLYVPLLGLFAFRLVRHGFSRLILVLALFCAIRLAVFIIRAILAGSSTAGTNRSVIIAEQVLISSGFLGLLYGAYGLALARLNLCRNTPDSPISRLTRNERLFDLVSTAAVVMGIVAASSDNQATAKSLREASILVFLVLTVLQTYQTIVLIRCEQSQSEYLRVSSMATFGARHGSFILAAMSALLLVREAFTTATMANVSKQNQESLWYPLVALPELLCVALYALPGLIPTKSKEELPEYSLHRASSQ
ncbi:hypothetical protein V5O48_006020 [Marasmius crinis-equi]|uniref:Uncharacterized protein n=1 Tax=Marasmius crinis-equi TaxID=585013 RepID=A0ABR3FKM9_9AGAR